jgi:hypothetical protein
MSKLNITTLRPQEFAERREFVGCCGRSAAVDDHDRCRGPTRR